MSEELKNIKSAIKDILDSFINREVSYTQAIDGIIDTMNTPGDAVHVNARVTNFASFTSSLYAHKKYGMTIIFDDEKELEKIKGISIGQNIVVSVEKDDLFEDHSGGDGEIPENAPWTFD